MAIAVRRYPLAQVTYGQVEIDAVLEALQAGQTTCGPRVKQFEESFAKYVGRNHAVMVNSGSSADLLVAYGLGQAVFDTNEVVVPAVTWPTQVWSCVQAGYKVRLVDVDPETLQIDVRDLTRIWEPTHISALFPVHVLGNVGDMGVLTYVARSSGIPLIEDCCEALGSRYRGQHVGTFGQAAAFSFFFSHLINTMEGGMVVCDDDDRQYRLWRAHGWDPEPDNYFSFSSWGFNLRPTELSGAFGNVQLGKLEQFKQARQVNYSRLADWTSSEFLRTIKVLPECEPAWHGFPLMIAPDAPFTKVALCKWLELHGIESRPIIAGNIARQKAVMDSDRVICGPLPGADQVHERGLYIGLSSFDDVEGCGYVAEVIHDFMKGY